MGQLSYVDYGDGFVGYTKQVIQADQFIRGWSFWSNMQMAGLPTLPTGQHPTLTTIPFLFLEPYNAFSFLIVLRTLLGTAGIFLLCKRIFNCDHIGSICASFAFLAGVSPLTGNFRESDFLSLLFLFELATIPLILYISHVACGKGLIFVTLTSLLSGFCYFLFNGSGAFLAIVFIAIYLSHFGIRERKFIFLIFPLGFLVGWLIPGVIPIIDLYNLIQQSPRRAVASLGFFNGLTDSTKEIFDLAGYYYGDKTKLYSKFRECYTLIAFLFIIYMVASVTLNWEKAKNSLTITLIYLSSIFFNAIIFILLYIIIGPEKSKLNVTFYQDIFARIPFAILVGMVCGGHKGTIFSLIRIIFIFTLIVCIYLQAESFRNESQFHWQTGNRYSDLFQDKNLLAFSKNDRLEYQRALLIGRVLTSQSNEEFKIRKSNKTMEILPIWRDAQLNTYGIETLGGVSSFIPEKFTMIFHNILINDSSVTTPKEKLVQLSARLDMDPFTDITDGCAYQTSDVDINGKISANLLAVAGVTHLVSPFMLTGNFFRPLSTNNSALGNLLGCELNQTTSVGHPSLKVYELSPIPDRIVLAKKVAILNSPEELISKLLTADYESANNIALFLDSEIPIKYREAILKSSNKTGRINTLTLKRNKIEIEVYAPEESLIIIKTQFSHKSRTFVDGQLAKTFPVNLAFTAILVPQGSKAVNFEYYTH